MSLKLKGLLRRIWCYRCFLSLLRTECGHVLGFDDPGRAFARLPSFDVATSDHTERGHFCDADDFRSSLQCYLAPLGPFALTIDRNVIVVAE
jgi:hypothetical protein